jgi:hypothetical protein
VRDDATLAGVNPNMAKISESAGGCLPHEEL